MAERSEERKDFLHGVFVTAMEGGVDYWCDVVEYRWSTGAPDYEADLDGFRAVLHDTDEDKRYTVDADTIARGIGVILAGKANVADGYRKRIAGASACNDAGDLDSIDADCIVQAGVLGEVVFG